MTDHDALGKRLREDCYCSDIGMVEMCKPCQAADAIRDLRAERDAAVELLKKIMEDRAEATWCFGTDLTDQIDAALAAQELKT